MKTCSRVLRYLSKRFSDIIWDDLLKEAEFVHDILSYKVRRIRV